MPNPKRVYFRNQFMIEEWPAKILWSQTKKYYRVFGQNVPRIAYGSRREGFRASGYCHDCSAIPGEFHVPGCDMERCPSCGGQAIVCGCMDDGELDA